MEMKEHAREIRDKVVKKFKTDLVFKKISSIINISQNKRLFNPSSENTKVMHNNKPTKTWPITKTDISSNESINWYLVTHGN